MNRRTRTLATKAIALALVVSLVTPAGLVLAPRKAEAVFPVHDTLNLIENAFVAVKEAANGTKEWALDPLAWKLAQLAIRSLQKSLVNWINSGFQGSPGFVTDLKQNLRGVGDAVVDHFFEELATKDITKSPFQDKILNVVRLGYYVSTSPESFYDANPYTLNQVSSDDRAFLEGDFSQGGFNAWLSAFMNPQNNPYGAHELANKALSDVVSDATNQRLQEFSWNRGFLSWRGDCVDPAQTTSNVVSGGKNVGSGIGNIAGGATNGNVTGSVVGGATGVAKGLADLSGKDKCAQYEIETPGSVIMEQLNHSLGSDVDKLVSADEFNEIIGALLNQLVMQVVGGGPGGGGLRSANKPAPGGGPSIIDTAGNDTDTGSGNSISANFRSSLAEQRANVVNFQKAWTTIRDAAQATKNRCGGGVGSPSADDLIERGGTMLTKATNALSELDAIQAKITEADNSNGEQTSILFEVSKMYTDLQSSGKLPTPEEYTEATTQSQESDADAEPASYYTQMTRLADSPACTVAPGSGT